MSCSHSEVTQWVTLHSGPDPETWGPKHLLMDLIFGP